MDMGLELTSRVSNMSLPSSMSPAQRRIAVNKLQELVVELSGVNPFVKDFKQICEIPDKELAYSRIVISANVRPQGEHEWHYDLQVCWTEISILHDNNPHDLVLRHHGGGLQEVSNLNCAGMPLHFMLIFPRGTMGWCPEMKHVDK